LLLAILCCRAAEILEKKSFLGVLLCTLYYKVLFPTIAVFQPQKNFNTTCNTKRANNIAIPVAILKSIAILIAIIAILHYYQPWPKRHPQVRPGITPGHRRHVSLSAPHYME